MPFVCVCEHGRWPPRDAIHPAADERKALRRQILHFRREIDAPREPRFHRVAVGRRDLDERPRREGANVRRHESVVPAAPYARAVDRGEQGAERGPECRAENERRSHGPDRGSAPRRAAHPRETGTNADLERLRRNRHEAAPAQGGAERPRAPVLRRAGRARVDVPLGFERRLHGELAVQPGVDALARETAAHRTHVATGAGAGRPSEACSRRRARERRDMTVPTGMPVTSAISR